MCLMFLLYLQACINMGLAFAAIPQPDVVFFGHVTQFPQSTNWTSGSVDWTVSANEESIVATNSTFLAVNSNTYYIARIHFETRRIVGGPALAASTNTLELTRSDTTYSRSATVNGRRAVLPDGKDTFAYGTFSQGLIERIDLVVGETFEEWSQRVFGTLVGKDVDGDQDGRTHYEEFLAGTDPKDPASVRFLNAVSGLPDGRFVLHFDTVAGHVYDLLRSTDLKTWTPVKSGILGDGSPTTWTVHPGVEPKLYFHMVVRE